MNRCCPWCSEYFPHEFGDERFYWHIKVHNAQEEAELIKLEQYERTKKKGTK